MGLVGPPNLKEGVEAVEQDVDQTEAEVAEELVEVSSSSGKVRRRTMDSAPYMPNAMNRAHTETDAECTGNGPLPPSRHRPLPMPLIPHLHLLPPSQMLPNPRQVQVTHASQEHWLRWLQMPHPPLEMARTSQSMESASQASASHSHW